MPDLKTEPTDTNNHGDAAEDDHDEGDDNPQPAQPKDKKFEDALNAL